MVESSRREKKDGRSLNVHVSHNFFFLFYNVVGFSFAQARKALFPSTPANTRRRWSAELKDKWKRERRVKELEIDRGRSKPGGNSEGKSKYLICEYLWMRKKVWVTTTRRLGESQETLVASIYFSLWLPFSAVILLFHICNTFVFNREFYIDNICLWGSDFCRGIW